MNNQEIRKLLEKQLQLLSEQSTQCAEARDLAALSSEMVKAAGLLLSFP